MIEDMSADDWWSNCSSIIAPPSSIKVLSDAAMPYWSCVYFYPYEHFGNITFLTFACHLLLSNPFSKLNLLLSSGDLSCYHGSGSNPRWPICLWLSLDSGSVGAVEFSCSTSWYQFRLYGQWLPTLYGFVGIHRSLFSISTPPTT